MRSDQMENLFRPWMFFIFCFLFTGIYSLKDIEVFIPLAVRVRDTITLYCKFDLEGEPLYTVKWYKGRNEFFSFIPKELPSTRVFALPGLDVDLSKSTSNEVVLRNVQPEVTGKYRCEVSSDAPSFDTKSNGGSLYVIDPPLDDPWLSIDKNYVDIGDIISGNCTSLPSYPATNISWYLNGKRIQDSFTRISQVIPEFSSGYKKHYITISGIELHVMDSTFQNGKAVLSCVATIFNIYRGERKEMLEEAKPRPRPSSVLGVMSGGQQTKTSTAKFILTLLFMNALQ
ncbi:uncharacterized protein LOC126745041 [Anthonomus grandis grandis]|uniref:uncharacterized protein LOC126745041 n=1 Tax=Anthonomus grandis grandis TaxID=2921223 RepID=UPI002166C109|nr:uncharacterized protein LOC126745041 [Anthonomus grandis grandis]